jgi:hypothetical protein
LGGSINPDFVCDKYYSMEIIIKKNGYCGKNEKFSGGNKLC